MFLESLGSETYEVLGFKSKEELDIEILKLTQVRSEFLFISKVKENS